MIIVAGQIAVEPGRRASYLAGSVPLVERSRAAAGCLDFAISADLTDPGRINIFERWASRAALDAARDSTPDDAPLPAILAGAIDDYDVADVRPFFREGAA